ncbi:MAG: phosphopyruvate hydratase [Proteobacteria bacterium]|nr:phosphopyruvate hydratase [Pseudomonadota bacterium]MCH9758534.1 phosphopyruvate hydratase [Pseudomonadota bacterium]
MPPTAISATICNLRGREILDSRGNPTVEAEITLSNGIRACAAAPSGASTGRHEAVEKRDGEARYRGLGVLQAVANINEVLAKQLIGRRVEEQAKLDAFLIELDGSENKTHLGANALLAVSLAAQKAAAAAAGVPLHTAIGASTVLPVPLMNIINGGAHASNNLDIQEFMIVPHGFPCFADALRAGCETFHALRATLLSAGCSTGVGDEGGYAPDVQGTDAALALIMQAIERAGYVAGEQISIALDCAASEFYQDGMYQLPADNFRGDATAFVELLAQWVSRYPIVSIEDGCDEEDWDGWRLLSQQLGARVQLVGDDVFVTNPRLLQRGIEEQVGNALLVKPNQIGTVSETLAAVTMAQQANYQTVMSHRSGETEYADIADLAVGSGCKQIKAGAPCRGERTAKYNQLLRIADALGENAHYGGEVFARPRQAGAA